MGHADSAIQIPPEIGTVDPDARRAEVRAALAAVMPPHAILSRGEDTVPYECDGLTAYRAKPLIVVLPESEAQVAAVLKTCHAMRVPVVARGAGTGLSGGALPHELGVTLSLAKFNRILKVDPVARTAVVQSGVRNLAISEAAAPHGLYYAPDPSSQIACTIGGNVAENSGGVHCLKYGLTLHNVMKVKGFTVEGEAVEFGSESLDAAGLDLMSLLVGSEGMLAVTTEITVKLVPKPQLARCIMASFGDIESAGDAVASVIAAGIIPAGLELLDKRMTAAVEEFRARGLRPRSSRDSAVRKRWHTRRSRGRNRAHERGVEGQRRNPARSERRRSATPQVLERPQERLSCFRPYQP